MKVKNTSKVCGMVAGTFLVIASTTNAQLLMKDPNQFDPTLYSGGDGSSCDNAIVLLTTNEAIGVKSEYVWLRHTFPGGQRGTQVYIPPNKNGKSYDTLEWKKTDGTTVNICFDISKLRS
jgi:hypothetical protein